MAAQTEVPAVSVGARQAAKADSTPAEAAGGTPSHFETTQDCLDYLGQRDETGGIALLCARIVDAWRDRPRQAINKASAVVASFAGETIAAPALVRLVATPGLLPSRYHGGLILKDLVVSGPLLLDSLSLDLPLAFVDATFRAGASPRASLLGFAENPADAISMRNLDLRKPFVLSRGTLLGNFRILRSKLSSTLLISDTLFDGHFQVFSSHFEKGIYISGVEMLGKGQGAYIEKSKIERELSFWGGQMSYAQLFRNELDYLRVWKTCFLETTPWAEFLMAQNQIGNAVVNRGSFQGGFVIQSNNIGGSLHAIGNRFGVDCDNVEQQGGAAAYAGISTNRITNEFQFKPSQIGGTVKLIELSNNQIDGMSDVRVPQSWRGKLQMDGNRLWWLQLATSRAFEKNPSCPETPDTVVDLTASEIRTLFWKLPIGCTHGWLGAGLRYELWQSDIRDPTDEPEPESETVSEVTTPEDDSEVFVALRNWVKTEQGSGRSDAKIFLAKYLEQKGQFNESRDVLEDAKRLNYAEGNQEGRWFIGCALEATPGVATFLFGKLRDFFLGTQETGRLEDPAWACARAKAMLFLLAPAGYGAKPEQALMLVFASWLVFAAIYWAYSFAHGRIYGSEEAANPTEVPGFLSFSGSAYPTKFSYLRFSLDTMIPVINLHAYDIYYPESSIMRFVVGLQHILGWWWITVFLAGVAIL